MSQDTYLRAKIDALQDRVLTLEAKLKDEIATAQNNTFCVDKGLGDLRLVVVKLRDVVEKIEIRQREIAGTIEAIGDRIESVSERISDLEHEFK